MQGIVYKMYIVAFDCFFFRGRLYFNKHAVVQTLIEVYLMEILNCTMRFLIIFSVGKNRALSHSARIQLRLQEVFAHRMCKIANFPRNN